MEVWWLWVTIVKNISKNKQTYNQCTTQLFFITFKSAFVLHHNLIFRKKNWAKKHQSLKKQIDEQIEFTTVINNRKQLPLQKCLVFQDFYPISLLQLCINILYLYSLWRSVFIKKQVNYQWTYTDNDLWTYQTVAIDTQNMAPDLTGFPGFTKIWCFCRFLATYLENQIFLNMQFLQKDAEQFVE